MFDMEKTRDQLLAYFVVTFFDWARSQGLKKRDSIPMFIESLYLYIVFCIFCNSLGYFMPFLYEVVSF